LHFCAHLDKTIPQHFSEKIDSVLSVVPCSPVQKQSLHEVDKTDVNFLSTITLCQQVFQLINAGSSYSIDLAQSAFSVMAPSIWNSLPTVTRLCDSNAARK